jgi:hypothetical protein
MDHRLLALLPVALVGRRGRIDFLHNSEGTDEGAFNSVTPQWVAASWRKLCARPAVISAAGAPLGIDSSAGLDATDGVDAGAGVVTRKEAFVAAHTAVERELGGLDPEAQAVHPALLDMSFWAWALQQP